MAVNETIITGRMYRVWDKANSIWKRFSYWTKASDVEMNDGTTVENTVSQLKTNITKLSSDTPWYGTCSTGASTATKVATTTDSKFALVTGAKVRIKFTYTNTATTPTLNVDSKGAKTIYGYGTTKPNSWWKAGDTVEFIYDGNYWIMSPSQGQIYQINNDLNDFSFRLNNGKPEYSTDGGTTWNKLGGGSIPTLDYSNPLYQFTTNTSYMCTMECYMVATALGTVSVNNVPLTSILTISNTSYPSVGLPLLKLRANDIVTLTGCDFRGTKVIIYKEA